ncbi:LOW QUALITY PROTEIN: SPRY domain-containing protein, partial [Cephalotus follicularis]
MEGTAPDHQHLCCLGISRADDPVGDLGESAHSFGYGGTGKFSHVGKFSDYGGKFVVGDTVVCAVDLESKPLASIGFLKNGKWLGTAMWFDAGLKGLRVVNTPMKKLPWFSVEEGLVPDEGFMPWSALSYGNAIMRPTMSNLRDCKVMMLMGLPA